MDRSLNRHMCADNAIKKELWDPNLTGFSAVKIKLQFKEIIKNNEIKLLKH